MGKLLTELQTDEQFKRLDMQDGIEGNLLKTVLSDFFQVGLVSYKEAMNAITHQAQEGAGINEPEGNWVRDTAAMQAQDQTNVYDENKKRISDLAEQITYAEEKLSYFASQFIDDPEALKVIDKVNRLNTMLENAANGLAPLAQLGGEEGGEGAEINLFDHMNNMNDSVASMVLDSSKYAVKSAEAFVEFQETMNGIISGYEALSKRVDEIRPNTSDPAAKDNSQTNAGGHQDRRDRRR